MESTLDPKELGPGKPLNSGPHTVRPEWIDYNGHMNIAFYVKALDEALDDIFDRLGCGATYRESQQSSTMTLELHINYIREIFEGDRYSIEFLVLQVWPKRVQVFCTMRREDGGDVSATFELMITHVSMTERRSSPFPDWLRQDFEVLARAHAPIEHPPQVGRAVGMPVKG